MRLIDADVLKTKFNKDSIKGFIITKIIDMQPTIDPEVCEKQPTGKWIPVAERLPKEYEDVLIAYRIPEGNAAWIGYRAAKEWWTYGVCCPNVTAWMPLPEPYEPDGV